MYVFARLGEVTHHWTHPVAYCSAAMHHPLSIHTTLYYLLLHIIRPVVTKRARMHTRDSNLHSYLLSTFK